MNFNTFSTNLRPRHRHHSQVLKGQRAGRGHRSQRPSACSPGRVGSLGDLVEVVLGPDYTSVGTPSMRWVDGHRRHVHTGSTPTAPPEDLTVTNAAEITCE